MTLENSSRVDSVPFRRSWSALVPFGALAVLSEVGAILSVTFQLHLPSTPTAGPDWIAILYWLSLFPVPVALACMMVGFTGARLVAVGLMWATVVLTLVNVLSLYENRPKAAVFVSVFLVPGLVALRLVHRRRMKEVMAQLDQRRRVRLGVGFGWMIVVSVITLCVSGATFLAIVFELTHSADSWVVLLKKLALLGGITLAALAVLRAPQTLLWLRGLLAFDLAVLSWLALTTQSSVACGTGAALSTAGLIILAQRQVEAFNARQRVRAAQMR